MGTTLTGTTPQDTYDSLIKVTDNGPISGTAKFLSDGLGNDSVLALSTTAVGIGTAVPLELLHLNSNSPVIQFTKTGILNWKLGNTTGNNFIVNTDAGGGDVLTLTTAGNVGIGTSNVSFDTGSGLRIERSGDSSIRLVGSGAAAEMTMTANGYQIDARNGYIRFLTGASVGSATERVRILADGGLTFNGDTTQANALDDYEEGTWTVGVAFGGASVDMTTSINTGTYTKIGRQVTVNGIIVLSSKGSSSGAAQITGLPFTIPNNNANYASASLWMLGVTFANQHQAYGNKNSTNINLEEVTEVGVTSGITNADFTNNSEIIVGLTYFV